MKYESDYLIKRIGSLPGIEIISNNLIYDIDILKQKWTGIHIFFHSDEKNAEGIFFLTRCLDRRYWEYGHKWRIELSVGDQIFENGDRPLIYDIFRPLLDDDNEKNIIDEITSLISNIEYHSTHVGFMSGFNIDQSKYNFDDFKQWKRNTKLGEIGI
jgi:hypothetical protein